MNETELINDYEMIDGDGVTYEIWEHEVNKSCIRVPIEIVRDFSNIKSIGN